ncbi:MAG: thioredoxin domain-containing protein [bacterium]
MKHWIIAAVIVIAGLVIWKFNTVPDYPEIVSPRPVTNPEASIKVEEFSDFQCPACGAAFRALKPELDKFGDKVSVWYRHFPLTSVHQNAFNAALASECANDQGKFWQYHDMLFDNQTVLFNPDLKRYAIAVGLDQQKFDNCLDSKAKKKVVKEDMKEGEDRGVNSTPTFFVNGKEVSNWQELPKIVQGLLGGPR